MSMREWAKREIELACKKERGNDDADEWDYGCACHESAYKAFLSLLDDDHSGMSIGFTKAILNRLIDGKPLTPIEDIPDIWRECVRPDTAEYKAYQCLRMSSLFKHVYSNGDVKYHDNNRMYCVDKDCADSGGWHNGYIAKLIDERYPITMPYMPHEKAFVVYCHDCLTDPANGDFDTLGVFYVIKPDGSKDEINRFFKESQDGWTEIDEAEYMKRLEKSKEVTSGCLYEQRCILFAALVNTFPDLAWKTHRHEDGELCFNGGWFLVGINTPEGSYTYHFENKNWPLFHCQEIERAPEWDGHTADDVERLMSLEQLVLEDDT